MKLNYFGYCLNDRSNDKNYSIDISPVLNAYCDGASASIKNSIEYNGEKLFLFKSKNGIYLFATTKNSEIIKKINTKELTLSEIHDILKRDEKLGFASFLYVGKSFIAIASTIFAPRIRTFSFFLDSIISKIGLSDFSVIYRSFTHTATRSEVAAFPLIRSATIRVDKDSKWHEKLKGLLGKKDDTYEDIDGFEIKMIPKHGGEITRSARRLLEVLPEDGLQRFQLKAKSDIDEILTDYYLDGRGSLNDYIHSRDDNKICLEMRNRIDENSLLQGKINEFKQQEAARSKDIKEIVHYSKSSSWASLSGGV